MARIHSYVVRYDSGFAPNPFYGYCTLATCKPNIRRSADIGDWVVGSGSNDRTVRRGGRLVYAMRVTEAMTFDEYIPFARAAVGDRYVVEMLNERGWMFGGENSGHILALDRHTTGDGTVAALQVVAVLRESSGTLKDLLADLKLYPQKLINVPISKGFPWQDDPSIQAALVEIERKMSGRGRVLLRASGTEPLLRVMVEGECAEQVLAAADELASVVRAAVQSG